MQGIEVPVKALRSFLESQTSCRFSIILGTEYRRITRESNYMQRSIWIRWRDEIDSVWRIIGGYFHRVKKSCAMPLLIQLIVDQVNIRSSCRESLESARPLFTKLYVNPSEFKIKYFWRPILNRGVITIG